MEKSSVASAIDRHLSANTDYTRLIEKAAFDLGFYRPIRFDKQTPHSRDEIYIIAEGTGQFQCGDEITDFVQGDVLFVPEGVEHCFKQFTFDFATWVIFLNKQPKIATDGGHRRLIWSNEFEVGQDQLDDEHRLFVDLINTIYAGAGFPWLRAKLGSLLDDLLHLTEQHFRNENTILLTINRSPLPSNVERSSFLQAVIDAAIDNHIGNHAQTLGTLRAIISDIRIELSGADPHINSDLTDWFIGHAFAYDARLRSLFQMLNQSRAM